jgi:hypothetical protein
MAGTPQPFPHSRRSLVAGGRLNTLKVGLSNAFGFFLYEFCKDLLEVDGRVSPVEWGVGVATVRSGMGYLAAQAAGDGGVGQGEKE